MESPIIIRQRSIMQAASVLWRHSCLIDEFVNAHLNEQSLMTMAFPRLLTVIFTIIIAGGGLYIAYTNFFDGSVELEARKLENSAHLSTVSSANDCAETGTCDASKTLYKSEQEEEAEQEKEEEDDESSCIDEHESCNAWAEKGECKKNPKYMLKSCRKSCLVCGKIEVDMGVSQSKVPGLKEEIQQRIDSAREYMISDFGRDPKKKRLLNLCKNKHSDCALWAVQGECEANPSYMTTNCAPVCHTCDQLDMSARCPINDTLLETNAWKPGDVNAFFTNLTTLPEYKQYDPQILSSPEMSNGPWVVTLDNVLTEEEAQRIIALGTHRGFEQSYAGGQVQPDGSYKRGYSEVRTSSNTWCEKECFHDPTVKQVISRITNITQVPEQNSEFLQVSPCLYAFCKVRSNDSQC